MLVLDILDETVYLAHGEIVVNPNTFEMMMRPGRTYDLLEVPKGMFKHYVHTGMLLDDRAFENPIVQPDWFRLG